MPVIVDGGRTGAENGQKSAPPPPASVPAADRLNGSRVVPSGIDQVQFPVFFPRNVERDLVGYEDRRDLRGFLTKGWTSTGDGAGNGSGGGQSFVVLTTVNPAAAFGDESSTSAWRGASVMH